MVKPKSIADIESQWDQLYRPKDCEKFQHYKGGKYEIVATGFLEDNEAPCVVYRSLEYGTVWVRTAKNFLEDIEYDGTKQPRFKRI
ncbi:MAG TPA: DUF1653 domain-containing protein [Candidatus Sulfotelmatobacter sp.]|nr:DUF1653 domain-containing protein [Candidatus Sulfotelmatobacter sp.]